VFSLVGQSFTATSFLITLIDDSSYPCGRTIKIMKNRKNNNENN
jgi:hypothetical protein